MRTTHLRSRSSSASSGRHVGIGPNSELDHGPRDRRGRARPAPAITLTAPLPLRMRAARRCRTRHRRHAHGSADKAHAQGEAAGDLGTGITLAAPLAKAHPAGSTVNGPTTGLISDSPQGQIIGVLNNDQDGLNYPAHKWGTDHYLNDLRQRQASGRGSTTSTRRRSRRHRTTIYGTVGIAAAAAQPAGRAWRSATRRANAVTQALQDLGQKYNFSIPLGEPAPVQEHGLGAGQPGIQTRPGVPAGGPGASTRRSSTTAPAAPTRCRSASAASRRSATSASTTRAPTRSWAATRTRTRPAYPSKPTLVRRCTARTRTSDYFSNLNFWASGTVHGPGGYDQPVRGAAARRRVRRDVVLVRHRLARRRAARCTKPNRPIAYFEMTPKKPTAQTTVTLRRRLQPDEGRQHERAHVLLGLRRRQPARVDDGSDRSSTRSRRRRPGVTSSCSSATGGDELAASFRQVEPIDFFPTYYPAVAPPIGAAAALERRRGGPVRRRCRRTSRPR